MQITICDSYENMSEKAAQMIAEQINNKPDSVLGLATGSTPLGLYKMLVDMNAKKEVDFSKVISFNLDEYYPMKQSDKNSYFTYMLDNFFSQVNMERNNIHMLRGDTDNPEAECEIYEKQISDCGGIDLQILGLGNNGHIGFNEPNKIMELQTHITKLHTSTIMANSRFFNSVEDVPKYALTMGIATIFSAKKIVIMASGIEKKKIISEMFNNSVNTSIPATLLKLHNNTVLLCDHRACCDLLYC